MRYRRDDLVEEARGALSMAASRKPGACFGPSKGRVSQRPIVNVRGLSAIGAAMVNVHEFRDDHARNGGIASGRRRSRRADGLTGVRQGQGSW